jgi:hypothetical protein
MPHLFQEERAFLTAHLERTLDLLQTALAGLSQEQWSFRPDENAWSIAECADHIGFIEKRAFLLVSSVMPAAPPDPERAARVQHKTELLLKAVPSREHRVKVPPGAENNRHSATPEEFLVAFETQRVELRKYVEETQEPVHDRVAPHPMFKDLDGYQWLLIIPLHTERHVAQIAEVKAHPAYPA